MPSGWVRGVAVGLPSGSRRPELVLRASALGGACLGEQHLELVLRVGVRRVLEHRPPEGGDRVVAERLCAALSGPAADGAEA